MSLLRDGFSRKTSGASVQDSFAAPQAPGVKDGDILIGAAAPQSAREEGAEGGAAPCPVLQSALAARLEDLAPGGLGLTPDMADIPDALAFARADAAGGLMAGEGARQSCSYEVERRIYGYLIRKIERVPLRLQLVQGGAWCAGIGLCLICADMARSGAALGGSLLLGGIAAALALVIGAGLLRFATRGLLPHIEVDLQRGTLREVMRHRTGGASLLHSVDFADVRGLRILPRLEARPGPSREVTMFCHIDTPAGPDLLEIASGAPDAIAVLEDLLRLNIRAVKVPPADLPAVVSPLAQSETASASTLSGTMGTSLSGGSGPSVVA